MILKYLLRSMLNIPVFLLSLIVVPVGLLFCKDADDRLPRILWWWDDPTYGINGDPYWRGPGHADGHEREYIWRLQWLFRNSLGGWSQYVMGADYANMVSVRYEGDPLTSNRPSGHSGKLHIWVTLSDGSEIEGLYVVRQWGSSEMCFRAYIGYKLKDVLDFYLRTGAMPRSDYAPDVFSVNPFMGFVK